MKIFGFEINRSKERMESEPHKRLLTTEDRYVPLSWAYSECRIPMFTAIAWPTRHHLDDFERVAYDKAVAGFVKSLSVNKRFDVCVLNELAALRCFKYTDETRKVKVKLSLLHCVDYANIPPSVLEQIPGMMNVIFSEGRLKEVTHTPEPKLLDHRT